MKKSKIIAAIAAAAMAVTAFMAIPASAETYHAYLGVQDSTSWTFRNAWWDEGYGRDTEYFAELHRNGKDVVGGSFTDAEITGDGTYKVSLNDCYDFGGAEFFSQLFVSTDIPCSAGVSITDVKVIIDGQTKYTFKEAFQPEDITDYMCPYAINQWNADLGGEDALFAYMMPTSSLEMEFTVSGMSAAAPAADAEAPAADNTTTSSGTGNTSAAVMLAVMAVAGAGAVVSKKRSK